MEQLYYFKILTLLKELNKHVHNLFKKKWKEIKKDDWEENPKFGKLLLAELDPKIVKELTSKKIQMKQLSEGCSSGWDLLIFSKIFSSKKFEEPTINSNLGEVKKIRNKLAHDISDLSLVDYQKQSQIIYNSFEALGKSKEEIKEIQKKLEELEKLQVNTNKNSNEKFESLKEKAQKFFQNKQYDEAIDAYQFVLEVDNISDDDKAIICCNKAACHYQLYLIYQEDHSIEQGISEAKKSIFYSPLYFKSYYRLAVFYELRQKDEKALIYYSKALTLCPNNEEIKVKVANLRSIAGQRKREEHLLSGYQPKTTEEKLNEDLDKMKNTVGLDYSMNDMNDMRKFVEEQDPVLADVFLAHDYRDGSNKVKKDLTKAVSYYSKAATKGNAEALFNLAMLTKEGAGVKQNFKLAIEFLKRAADMPPKVKRFKTTVENVGVKEAQHSLGLFYTEGVYVEKNEFIARSWYEKAVENGYGFSANNLGLFYMHGFGGPVDLKKAEKLLLFAHEKEDPRAKQNLVALYIHLAFPEKALIWHNICLKDNSLSYLEFSDSNILMINNMLSDFKRMGVQEWEKENGLSYENLNQIQRIDRYNSKNKNSNFSLENFMNQIEKSQNPVPTTLKSNENLKNRYKDLFDPSHNGSKTALNLRESIISCSQALNIFREEGQNSEKIITLLATSIELEETGCLIPQNELEEIIHIVEKALSKKKTSELNKNARICHIHFHMQNYEDMLLFCEECLKFYPQVLYFHIAKGAILSFLKKFLESNKVFDEALKIQNNNCDVIYQKAAVVRHIGKNDESIKYYKLFLDLAEKDNRKYPEAHYAIGLIFCVKVNMNAAEDWYKKGLEAEKIQLSFYLPYDSACKPYLKTFLNLNDTIPASENTSAENEIEMSLHKKALIIEHRTMVKNMKNALKNLNGKTLLNNTVKPRLNNVNFNPLDKFQPIFFNEIDTTKDYVLKGFVLTVVILDIPIFGFESIGFIIQDQNQDAHFLSIYNLKGTEKEITEDFGVGTEIQIFHPYMRIAADGKARIRVDDPETVKILNKLNKTCRVCFKQNCSLFCGKCKIASYCSKKCQIYDWKVLDHTLICIN